MAEAFLNQLGGDHFEAESAGLNPRTIIPAAAKVMREIGLPLVSGIYDFGEREMGGTNLQSFSIVG
jgi:protein-tyrosine-phosphatase